jgi:lipoyltransferase 1
MAFVLVQVPFKPLKVVGLLSKTLTGIQGCLPQAARKQLSTSPDGVNENDIKKSVFISQSKNIFENLALEEWMFKNLKFVNHHIMLLWRNDPCVVIGRNQNPWAESNTELLEKKGIKLARRNSGGGTVYHDEGNLNVTFFAPKERYNRKHNLQLLAKSLEREWNIHSEINEREDIILDSKYKISGTASRIARPNSYHHCTLLVDVNKNNLGGSLRLDPAFHTKSKATRSTPAPTVNLNEVNSKVSMDKLIASIGWEYLRTTPITQKDGGWDLVSQQNGFQLVNPSNEWFPGIEKMRTHFSSWDWCYGFTPDFEVRKDVVIDSSVGEMTVEIEVKKGIVRSATLFVPEGLAWGSATGPVKLITSIAGEKYRPELFNILVKAIKQQGFEFSFDQAKRSAATA